MRATKALLDFDPEGFEMFWRWYPRHEAKKDAQRAWCQMHPSRAALEMIQKALLWQSQQAGWVQSIQFIPLPASYLRGERWTDERPMSTKSTIVNNVNSWWCPTCRAERPQKLRRCHCGAERPS